MRFPGAFSLAAQQHLKATCAAAALTGFDIEEENEEEADSLINAMKYDMAVEADGVAVFDVNSDVKLQPVYTSDKRQRNNMKVYTKHLKIASAQILVSTTRKEYESLWATFVLFCEAEGFVSSAQAFEDDCAANKVPGETPTWIAMWIMAKCDKRDLRTGEVRPLQARPSYSTAQKMRAAMSHKFGRDFQRGQLPWAENQLLPGAFSGNPSISTTVSEYMISLRRTKVQDGEVAVSARALDDTLLTQLVNHNRDRTQFTDIKTDSDPLPTKRKRPGDDASWDASFQLRTMLNCIYIISFLCLLRFDEVLNIEWASVNIDNTDPLNPCIELRLPFRKTHQTGGIAPFYLYRNESNPVLCPITAISEYLAMVTTKRGWMFRNRIGATFSQQPSGAMSADSFLQCFRNNLLDVGVNPRPFGTHSFRRGGCQHLANRLRWPIRDICQWGGWAENYDNPGIIFKYLLAFVDSPTVARKDFFNPNRPRDVPCPTCNRTCWCR